MLSPDSYRDRLSIGSVEPEKKHFFCCFPDLFKDQYFYFYGNRILQCYKVVIRFGTSRLYIF